MYLSLVFLEVNLMTMLVNHRKCTDLNVSGMKQSPRFREGVAYLRTKNQPLHIKYPLILLHVVANVDPVYTADQLNIKKDVSCTIYLLEALHQRA